MNLLKRIKFALKYDIEPEFIIYSAPDQTAIRFLNYDEAKQWSDRQIQYRPKVLVGIKKVGS